MNWKLTHSEIDIRRYQNRLFNISVGTEVHYCSPKYMTNTQRSQEHSRIQHRTMSEYNDRHLRTTNELQKAAKDPKTHQVAQKYTKEHQKAFVFFFKSSNGWKLVFSKFLQAGKYGTNNHKSCSAIAQCKTLTCFRKCEIDMQSGSCVVWCFTKNKFKLMNG